MISRLKSPGITRSSCGSRSTRSIWSRGNWRCAGRSDAAEAARLSQLLGIEGSLAELNRALAERIANGEVDLQTPGLSEHLWQTTMDKLAVDQPNYASYKQGAWVDEIVGWVERSDTHRSSVSKPR